MRRTVRKKNENRSRVFGKETEKETENRSRNRNGLEKNRKENESEEKKRIGTIRRKRSEEKRRGATSGEIPARGSGEGARGRGEARNGQTGWIRPPGHRIWPDDGATGAGDKRRWRLGSLATERERLQERETGAGRTPRETEVAPRGGSSGALVALAGAGPRQGWAEAWRSWCSGRRWLRPVNWVVLQAD